MPVTVMIYAPHDHPESGLYFLMATMSTLVSSLQSSPYTCTVLTHSVVSMVDSQFKYMYLHGTICIHMMLFHIQLQYEPRPPALLLAHHYKSHYTWWHTFETNTHIYFVTPFYVGYVHRPPRSNVSLITEL